MSLNSAQRRLNEWARENYGLPYGRLAALVALVEGYRKRDGRAVATREVEQVLQNVEGRFVEVNLRPLERLRLARCVRHGWFVPTELALSKFPALPLVLPVAADASFERGAA